MTQTETLIEDDRWRAVDLAGLAQKAAEMALEQQNMGQAGFEISILGCDDARIAALNNDFRDKPTPTNVLSWPSEERGALLDGERPLRPKTDADTELGDIAISYDTCAREATAAGKPLKNHATHLIVHAVLHLLGYDHIRDKDAALMLLYEREVLGKLGLPDHIET
ncbi:Metal-dependent hydrolase YbeY, involved in rRNA and/or ribosome maturation and assembly [hydrothermal vent metagenome]|uniref:Metal-dependent hydrolase YbeY, involved in rRNA and/or ribosome maturation and assembly n=1 Tax=hydrothermal vent metagenome TaxID=652676 RepID=A0A3B0RT46_9ZZZZ